jgi:hypothetical protein
MLWTLVPTLGWVAFLWIGSKAHKRQWQVWAAVYFVIFFLGVWVPTPFIDTKHDNALTSLVGLLVIVGLPVMLAHAFFVRHDYLLRMTAFESIEAKQARAEVAAIQADYTDTDAAKRAQALFAQCNDLVGRIEDELAAGRVSMSTSARTEYVDALEARSQAEAQLDKARRPHEFEQIEPSLNNVLDRLKHVYGELTASTP